MLVDLGNYTGSRLITQHLVGFCRRLPSSITAIFRKSVLSTWVHRGRVGDIQMPDESEVVSSRWCTTWRMKPQPARTTYNHQMAPNLVCQSRTPCGSEDFVFCSARWFHPEQYSIISNSQWRSPSQLGRDWKNTKSYQIHIKSYKLIHKKHQIIPNPYKSPRDVLS